MDRFQPDNPLADLLRSMRNPQPVRVEMPPSEARRERERAREREREPEPEPPRRRPVAPLSASARMDAITLREMLSTRTGLRRSFILTEVLGPPKALRREQ